MVKPANLSRRRLLASVGGGAVLSQVPRPVRAASKPITVGFIYVGPRDDYGYNQAHAQGAASIKSMPGITIHERAGARLLDIPANYYEDVSARLGLDDAETAALGRLRMLYDRDGGGTFRRSYTETFERRFFFEIVERQDAYAGFGAANAAVRMAAQARHGSIRV